MKTNCPHCHAHVSPVTLRGNQSTSCPFCGRDVSGVLAQWEAARHAVGKDARDAGYEVLGKRIEPVPAKSRIEVVEATPERLVLFIPPASRDHADRVRWLVFQICLAAFMVVLYLLQIVFGDPELWVVKVLNLAPTTLFGLMVFYGIKSEVPRFCQSTLLSLDVDRLTLEHRYRFRNQFHELPITTATTCSLAPLGKVKGSLAGYDVLFETDARKVAIGSFLAPTEREWLVRQFNVLLPGGEIPVSRRPNRVSELGTAAMPATAASGTATTDARNLTQGTAVLLQRTSESRGIVWGSLTSQELPRGTSIEVQRDTAEILEFAFPLQFGWEWLPFSLLFALGVILTTVWDPFVTLTGWLVLAPFLIRFLYLMLGTVIVRVTPDTVECCWKSCGTVLADRMAVADITQVGLGYLTVLRRRNFMYYPSPGFARNPGDGCWLEEGRRRMTLASVSPPDVSVEVLGLIVGRLESWGAIEVAPLPQESKPAVPATPT